LASQQPGLFGVGEWPPEVGMPVRPGLRLKPPAAVRVAFESYERAGGVMQERYSRPCGFRDPAAIFAPTPKLAVRDCSRPLDASWLM
jgi:hypothetical protein